MYLTGLYKALLCTAYYGLFRIGELTQSLHVVKAADVHVGENKNKLMFILHMSKTHSKGDKLQIIKINSKSKVRNKAKIGCGRTEKTGENSSNAACPFTTLKNYLKLRKSY